MAKIIIIMGPILTRGGVQLNRGDRMKRLVSRVDSIESKHPRRERGRFYDNIQCQEIPSRSSFLPI